MPLQPLGDMSGAEEAAHVVMLAGGELHQRSSMGSYVRIKVSTQRHHGGRPIYKNPQGMFLYFWAADGNWLVSADYDQEGARLASNIEGHAWCPSRATGWKVFHDGDLHWDSNISVTQVFGQPTEMSREVRCNLADQLAIMAAAAAEHPANCSPLERTAPEPTAKLDGSSDPAVAVEDHDRGSSKNLRGLFSSISVSPPKLWAGGSGSSFFNRAERS